MKFYLDERERRKQRQSRKLKIYGGIAVFLFLIFGIGWLIVYSSVFQIKNIELISANNESIGAGLIDDFKDFLVQQSKIAEFLGANNILIWQNKNNESFLKNHPEIADLTIIKKYFERKIEILINKREKSGMWCFGEKCWWFDKEGTLFEEAPIASGELIYKVNDFSDRELSFGGKAMEKSFIDNLLKIFEVLDKAKLGVKTLRLNNLALQEMTVESSKLPKIYFSLRFDPGFGVNIFESLKKIGLDKIEYIDLRVENRGYYKLK